MYYIYGIFFYLLIFLNFSKLISKELIISNSKFYDSETKEFSPIVDLVIYGDRIKEIKKSSKKEVQFYILPTFCDIDVTLGMDSMGSGNTLAGVDLALRSYLYHGFSHIHTIHNPPWVLYLKNKEIKFPIIQHGPKAILYSPSEYPELSNDLYSILKDKSDLNQMIHSNMSKEKTLITLLNRYHKNNLWNFDSEQFHDVLKGGNKKTKIIVSNFGDQTGILDSIRAGVQLLKDPISIGILKMIPMDVFETIEYIPQINVYHNLYIQSDESMMEAENIYRASLSNFYKKYYYEEVKKKIGFKTISIQEIENIKIEYPEYIKFLKVQKNKPNPIIISGGSGNYLSFPGISAIRELTLLNDVLENPNHLIQGLTKKSCGLFLEDYDGTIQEGGKANLLLYKRNPLENLNQILDFQTIYINGLKVKREEIKEKKNK